MLAALGLSRRAWIAIAIAGLLVAAGGFFAYGALTLRGMIDDAAVAARNERDAHWKAQIAESNARVERERAEQAGRVAALEARAASEVARLRDNLLELEKANAALPDADRCGLDRDRVRLLAPAR